MKNIKQMTIADSSVNKKYTIDDSIREYLNEVNMTHGGNDDIKSKIKLNTYERYKSDLKRFRIWIKENYPNVKYTAGITQQILMGYTKYLSTLKKDNGEDFSYHTKSAYFNSVIQYIYYLGRVKAINQEAYDYMFYSKFSRIAKKKAQKETSKGYLSLSTIKQIFDNIEKVGSKMSKVVPYTAQREKVIMYLLFHGFRSDEIMKFKWVDINLENKTIRVYRGKTEKETTVRLSNATAAELLKFKGLVNPCFTVSNAYIFPHAVGNGQTECVGMDITRHIGKNTLVRAINRFSSGLVDSEGREVTAHTFRKTFCCILYSAGYTLSDIQQYTGDTLQVLNSHYVEVMTEENFKKKPVIEDYFSILKGGSAEVERFAKKEFELKLNVEEILKDDELIKAIAENKELFMKIMMSGRDF